LQCLGISHAGGLQCSGLGLQAGEFTVHKLDAGQLCLGFVGQAVEFVILAVDVQGRHIHALSLKNPTPL